MLRDELGRPKGEAAMFLVCGDSLFDFFLESEDGPGAAGFAARVGGSPLNTPSGWNHGPAMTCAPRISAHATTRRRCSTARARAAGSGEIGE